MNVDGNLILQCTFLPCTTCRTRKHEWKTNFFHGHESGFSLASDLWSNHLRARSTNCWVHKYKFRSPLRRRIFSEQKNLRVNMPRALLRRTTEQKISFLRTFISSRRACGKNVWQSLRMKVCPLETWWLLRWDYAEHKCVASGLWHWHGERH